MPVPGAPLSDQSDQNQQHATKVESDLSALPDVPGGWTTTDIAVADRHFPMLLPAIPDAFLDDPQVLQANHESDYMPYWAHLWPAATHMANLILQEPWPTGTPALELGSGVGLVGIAGLAAGLRVTFSDYDPTSLQVAVHNARQNGVEPAGTMQLDWRNPDASQSLNRFPLILGCDVLYEAPQHEPVLNVLDRFLDDDGVCWLGDPGRMTLTQFCQLARRRGYSVELRDDNGAKRLAATEFTPAFHLVVLRRHKSHEMQPTK